MLPVVGPDHPGEEQDHRGGGHGLPERRPRETTCPVHHGLPHLPHRPVSFDALYPLKFFLPLDEQRPERRLVLSDPALEAVVDHEAARRARTKPASDKHDVPARKR